MNQKNLFTLWGCLFIFSAAFGFIPEPQGILKYAMIVLAVLFFLPPALILCRGTDRRSLILVRNLSLLSLGLTVVLLIANVLSLMAPESLGNVLYGILIIVSAPMVCGQYWVLSLFGWACLMFLSLSRLGKKA